MLKELASKMSSAYGSTRLTEDLHELQEELEVAKSIAEEERLEREILVETKSLLILQSQRHAAELPRPCIRNQLIEHTCTVAQPTL